MFGSLVSGSAALIKKNEGDETVPYRGASLRRNSTPPGPYIRTMPKALGGGRFLMIEVPLQSVYQMYGHKHSSDSQDRRFSAGIANVCHSSSSLDLIHLGGPGW